MGIREPHLVRVGLRYFLALGPKRGEVYRATQSSLGRPVAIKGLSHGALLANCPGAGS
jgi:hypothetical protein